MENSSGVKSTRVKEAIQLHDKSVKSRLFPSPIYLYLLILALCGFVTSFGAHIVATNLPAYAEQVAVGAFMIGMLIAVYDFAELFAKPYGMRRKKSWHCQSR